MTPFDHVTPWLEASYVERAGTRREQAQGREQAQEESRHKERAGTRREQAQEERHKKRPPETNMLAKAVALRNLKDLLE
ncbi:hypothetical protein NHX12_001365 [Muraenolepis orangiensis]|uniref:Uncharacterized protein n=1 Tax=Muraenolepis orangiensis TaxID=630683 RepID=A0A9Q0IGJ1_9TELE|nr:hypothetical protein NHX12_001365 [Muraenolepis orangiensis]